MPAARLRVLEVFEPRDGGVAEHVRLLAHGLVARGAEVTVAGRPDAGPRGWLEAQGIRYLPVSLTGRVPDPVPDTRALLAISRELRRGGYNMVHAHGQKAGIVGRLAAKRHQVASVYTPHAFVYRTQGLRPRISGKLRFKVGLRMERNLARWSGALITVAQSEKGVALDDRLVPAEKVVVIHPGVEAPGAGPVDERLRFFREEEDGVLFGFVAGLREQKGLPVLLDALELLAERETPLRFVIVGNGPLRDEVAARVESAPLAGHTLLLPFEGESYPYLRGLDVFVLPSLWEGLPIAVLEAMATGLPVVATAVNGTPEAVEDGVTGYLVPPADPEALAYRLQTVASSPERREEMGRAAREVAQTMFGIERMVDEIVDVYRAARAGLPPGPT